MQKHIEAKKQIPGRRDRGLRVQLICEDPSLTQQSFTKDSSIRTILAKYAKTGILGDPNKKPIYGDFSEKDYSKALNLCANVKSGFELLDPKIRERFKNDPGEMLAFLSDEKNHPEAIKLGLREAPPYAGPHPQDLKTPEPPPAAPATPTA